MAIWRGVFMAVWNWVKHINFKNKWSLWRCHSWLWQGESLDGEGGRVIVLELSCLESAHAKPAPQSGLLAKAGLGWTSAAHFLSRSQKEIPREAAGLQQHGRWLPGWPDRQHSRMRVWVTATRRDAVSQTHPWSHPCWKFSFRYYLGTGWGWGVISSRPPAAGHILNKWVLCKSGVFKF